MSKKLLFFISILLILCPLRDGFSRPRSNPELEPYNRQIKQATTPEELARAHAFRARKLILLDHPREAVTDYEKSVRTREMGWVLMELGNLYYKLGNYEKALQTASIVVKKYPHLASRAGRLQNKAKEKVELYGLRAGRPAKTMILDNPPDNRPQRTRTKPSGVRAEKKESPKNDGTGAYFEAAAGRVMQNLRAELRKKIKGVKWITDNVFRSPALDRQVKKVQQTRKKIEHLEKQMHTGKKMMIDTFARMNQEKLKLEKKAREQEKRMHAIGSKLCWKYQTKYPEFRIKYTFGDNGCIARYPADNTIMRQYPGKTHRIIQYRWIRY